MRSPALVLMVSDDREFAEVVRAEVRGLNHVRLRTFPNIQEAVARTATALPGLIVVHLNGRVTDEQVAYLLGRAGLPQQHVPVLAVADDYDADQALKMFRLGVTDYLGRAEHHDRLGPLVDALVLRRESPAPVASASPRAPKRWRASSPLS